MEPAGVVYVVSTLIENVTELLVTSAQNENFPSPETWQEVFMWVVVLLVVLLNSIVFVVVPLNQAFKTPTGYAMLSLATADMLLGLFSLFRLVYVTVYGQSCLYQLDLFCAAEGFFMALFAGVSIMTLTFLSLDKWVKLAYPLEYHTMVTKPRAVLCLIGIWVYAACLLWPFFASVWNISTKYYSNTFLCIPNWTGNMTYTVLVITLVFLIPFLITMFSYVMILRIALQYLKRKKRRANTIGQKHNTVRKELHLVKMLCFMTVGFYIAWTPYLTTMVFPELLTGRTLGAICDFIAPWFGASNSFWNPVIYFPTLKIFRNTFKGLFCKGMDGVKWRQKNSSNSNNRSSMCGSMCGSGNNSMHHPVSPPVSSASMNPGALIFLCPNININPNPQGNIL